MTSQPTSATRPSPLPVLLAVVVGLAALLHLLFGQDTTTRTVLVVVAVAAALLTGVVGTRARAPRAAVLALGALGGGAAFLLGVSYL